MKVVLSFKFQFSILILTPIFVVRDFVIKLISLWCSFDLECDLVLFIIIYLTFSYCHPFARLVFSMGKRRSWELICIAMFWMWSDNWVKVLGSWFFKIIECSSRVCVGGEHERKSCSKSSQAGDNSAWEEGASWSKKCGWNQGWTSRSCRSSSMLVMIPLPLLPPILTANKVWVQTVYTCMQDVH